MGNKLGSLRNPITNIEDLAVIMAMRHDNYKIINKDNLFEHYDEKCNCYAHRTTSFKELYVTQSCWDELNDG
jgi:hypothetical protein